MNSNNNVPESVTGDIEVKKASPKSAVSILGRLKNRYGVGKKYIVIDRRLQEVHRKPPDSAKVFRQVSEALPKKEYQRIEAHNKDLSRAKRLLYRDVAIGGTTVSGAAGLTAGHLEGKNRGKQLESLRYAQRSGDIVKRANNLFNNLKEKQVISTISKLSNVVNSELKKINSGKNIRKFVAAGLIQDVSITMTKRDIMKCGKKSKKRNELKFKRKQMRQVKLQRLGR